MQPADCYKILGVPFGASTEEVTAAYKKLSEKFHPDADAGDPFFQERFKEVQEAYQTLINLTTTTAAVAQTTDEPIPYVKNITPPASPIPARKKRGTAIGGAVFGILIIGVVIFKFVSERKKMSDTEQNLQSLGLLPKDKGNAGPTASDPNSTKSSTTPTGSDSRGSISLVRDEIFVLGMMNDVDARLEVRPSFTIYNAKNVLCHAVLYFYDEQGNPLKTGNLGEYTSADGTILSSLDFRPAEDQVKYSSGRSDLVLSIPYSKLYLSPGRHRIEYELFLTDSDGNLLDKSGRMNFSIEQN